MDEVAGAPVPLDENQVIEAVCLDLEAGGFVIEQRLHTTQQGVDIVALGRDGQRLHVEAKGATSSRRASKNYGKPYGSAEVRINVAEAFYTAAAVVAQGIPDLDSGMAFQDDPLHRRYVDPLLPVCRDLGIAVFWARSPASANP